MSLYSDKIREATEQAIETLSKPEFEVAMRYNSLGRLDTYVKPSGGSVDLDLTSVLNDISAWKKE